MLEAGMQRIALLGLGTMGMGMAANWLAKGFELSVWNRTPQRADALVRQGARLAASPAEAARDADVIVAMVADDEASRQVWLGPDGALDGARAGAIIIESSTLTPKWVRDLAAMAAGRGCRLIDAPVGGSKAAAAGGQLIFFAGGDASALEEARPVLEAVGQRINHLGPTGAGANWKLINNMLVAVHLAALGKAMALAERSGFDREQAAQLILASAAASPIVQGKIKRMLEHEYGDPDFSVKLMLKDAGYAIELADELGMRPGIIEGAAAEFERAVEEGLGEMDVAAIAEIDRQPDGR
jgi:3-hydroxyisobutyrate dehydrogenase